MNTTYLVQKYGMMFHWVKLCVTNRGGQIIYLAISLPIIRVQVIDWKAILESIAPISIAACYAMNLS